MKTKENLSNVTNDLIESILSFRTKLDLTYDISYQ